MEFIFYLFLGLMIGIPLADTQGAKNNATLMESITLLFFFTVAGIVILNILGYGHMVIFGPVTIPSGFGS